MSISFKEDHISQIPALLMLEKLGYTYLTPDEALALRGGNLANVLLEPVLRKQLAAINVVQVSSVRTTVFSEQNITPESTPCATSRWTRGSWRLRRRSTTCSPRAKPSNRLSTATARAS